jgi:hypothetical protein
VGSGPSAGQGARAACEGRRLGRAVGRATQAQAPGRRRGGRWTTRCCPGGLREPRSVPFGGPLPALLLLHGRPPGPPAGRLQTLRGCVICLCSAASTNHQAGEATPDRLGQHANDVCAANRLAVPNEAPPRRTAFHFRLPTS